MSCIIAIAGKGGTGKTTFAALLIHILSKCNSGTILGIDADPNSNLAEAMGYEVKADIGSIVDALAKNPQSISAGTPKDVFIDFRIQTSIIENKGFDLLAMGRPEGPGCYCYVNNLLRGLIKKLADKYDYIVIDNEAGFEHLSRRTMRKADRLFLVSDPSEAGLRAAKRILKLIKELEIDIKNISLILNRAGSTLPQKAIKELGIEVSAILPEDKSILDLSRRGKPVTGLSESSRVYQEIKKILLNIKIPR